MKIFKIFSVLTFIVSLVFVVSAPSPVSAATTPDLGTAATYGVLSSTFTRNVGITAITGDLGATTIDGGGSHTLTGGALFQPAPAQAGIDQGNALATLAANPCTFTFADGAIDLATDTTHGSVGVYAPGVYCTGAASAASIGTAGITLSGAGTYIFRISGALTSVDNSTVTLADGASSCDVFWSPDSATTLGADTTFKGTIIDDAGITVGNSTVWTGQALAFGGTVTTNTNIIDSTCATAPLAAATTGAGLQDGTINVVKVVINDSGGTKTIADFPLFVSGRSVISGVTNDFEIGDGYLVTETTDPNYTSTFSGDCGSDGRLNIGSGMNKTCIVTNNDIGAPLPVVPPLIDVVKVPSPLALPAGPGPVTYTYTLRNIGTVPVTDVTMVGDSCSPINLVSGDLNTDAKLDVDEIWTYQCAKTLTETTTNIVTATGYANGISAVDIASATVVVGVPIIPPLIHIEKRPNVFLLPVAGGAVTYTYTITNPGTAPLSDVSITDDKCTGLPGRVVGHPGDLNKNNLLESNEAWKFTCQSSLMETTTNIGTAEGSANGLTVKDFAIATVVVSAPAPTLPNTGITPDNTDAPWNIVIPAGILAVIASLYFARRKQVL